MLTNSEIISAIVIPLAVSAIIALVGAWRRWRFAIPLAAGAGFIAGYAHLGLPKLPPSNGTDWLFWLAIPLTLLAALEARLDRWWGVFAGAAAGAIVAIILMPLPPQTLSRATLWQSAVVFAAASTVTVLIIHFTQRRIPAFFTTAGLFTTLAGAALLVFASRNRTLGIVGVIGAMAMLPVALASLRASAPRALAILSLGILAALLAAGRFYDDPGITGAQIASFLIAPAIVPLAAFFPGRRRWIAGAVGFLAATIIVGATAVPAAIKAKKDAEADPYAAYR